MSTVSWKFAVLMLAAVAGAPAVVEGQITVGRGIVEHDAAPGARYRGSIPISNGAGEARRVRLYLADYTFDAAGATRFAAPGSSERSSAPWTELGSAEIVVPAGHTVNVAYTVVVPETAPANRGEGLQGSYWNVVMIEAVPGDAEGERRGARARPELAVRQVMRTAVVLVTHIGGTGEAELSFESPHVVRGQRTRVLEVDVRNTGTRAVRPELTTELFDAAGRSHGKVRGIDRMLFPGTSARYRFELGTPPPGRYTTVVLGDAGGDDVFGAQYGVSF